MYFLDKAARTRIISSVDTVGTGTQGSSLLVIDFIQQISKEPLLFSGTLVSTWEFQNGSHSLSVHRAERPSVQSTATC